MDDGGMAQQSARRGPGNPGLSTVRTKHAMGDLDQDPRTPIQASTATAAHNRPDRWQHPTTCQNFEIHPCAEGGVHRWKPVFAPCGAGSNLSSGLGEESNE